MMFLLRCPSAYVLELELDGQSAAPLRWGPDDDLRAVARRWQGEHAAGRTDVEDVLMRFMEAHANGSATAAAQAPGAPASARADLRKHGERVQSDQNSLKYFSILFFLAPSAVSVFRGKTYFIRTLKHDWKNVL